MSIYIVLLTVGIGLVVVPFLSIPFYYWTTGHLYGQLGAKLLADREGATAT